MSSEDLEFINILVDAELYKDTFELLIAAIDADTAAALLLLSDFQ